MLRRAAIVLGITTTMLLASAGDARAEGWQPIAVQQRAGADLYWWSAKLFGSSFGLVPFLQYGLTENVFLDAKLPLAANVNGPDDKTRFGLGNPMIGAHYAVSTSSLTWYVGGHTNLPVLTLTDDITQQFPAATAGIAMVLHDVHLWTSYYLPVMAMGGVEIPASDAVMIRAELDPGVFIPLKDKLAAVNLANKSKVQFLYEARAEVEARAPSGIGGGGGLQFVHVPTADGDNAQLAAEGFVGYASGDLFLRGGILLALDEPYGFGFDKGKVVTLHLQAGTRF